MSLRVHSLRRKKYCFMYEIPLKTSQKPDAGERTGKRYISCVTARPIRVIIVKKLNSLKHLVRTTVAELHN